MNVEDARQVLLGGKEQMVENALVILKSKYEQLFPKVSQKLKKSLYNFIILGSQIGDFWAVLVCMGFYMVCYIFGFYKVGRYYFIRT